MRRLLLTRSAKRAARTPWARRRAVRLTYTGARTLPNPGMRPTSRARQSPDLCIRLALSFRLEDAPDRLERVENAMGG